MFGLFKKPVAKPEVNFHLLNNSVVLNFQGQTLALSKDDHRYTEVLKAIRENNLGSIPGIVKSEMMFESIGLALRDGVLYAGDEAIPSELNLRILQYKREGLPHKPLLNFWENLKQNPSYNARTMLFKFLEHNGHPITEDGSFIAYRGVTEDFKDLHTKKFDNSVGAVCEMPRDQVDDNPNNTCSSGLHVACFNYAKDFGPQLIEVKVNPRDVVAVPTDYNGTKMRTCRFEVVSVGQNMREELLYGHESPAVEEVEEDQEVTVSETECPECGEEDIQFYNYCPQCGEPVKN